MFWVQNCHVSTASFDYVASGKTGVQWIDTIVVREAERLLLSTTMSVAEICTRLGFDDPSAFGKYFKRIKGVSPKHFREMQ